MAHIKYDDGKGAFFLARNTRDFPFFDGDNLSSINEAETMAAIQETPQVSLGTYISDIVVPNETTVQRNEADGNLFSKIDTHSRIVGAKFTPLVLSANVKLDNKDYEIFATYKNNSNHKFPSVLKLFETIDGKKQEVDIANKRVFFNELRNQIADIFTKASEQYQNLKYETTPDGKQLIVDENGKEVEPMANDIVSLFKTHPETVSQTDDGMLPNINVQNLATMLPVFKNIVEKNKNLFPEADHIIANIDKFMANQNINLVMMNLQSILDNRKADLSSKFGLDIVSTTIEEYQIDAVSNGNSVSFKYSALKNAPSENGGDVFKTSYVKDEVRADMKKFVEEAQKDPYVAYHLLNELRKSVSAESAEYITLLTKEKNGNMNDQDRQRKNALNIAINEKLSVLKNSFTSVDFSEGEFLMKNFGENNPLGVLNVFAAKIATKISNINDAEKLRLTKDGDRIIRDSNAKSIWYNTNIPFGLGIAEFSKEFGLKGTMSNDIRLKPSIALTSFVIPTKSYTNKDNEVVEIPQKTLLPKNTSTIDKKILEILSKIDRMKLDGTIEYTPGSGYSSQANITKEIDFLTGVLVPHEKIGLESKRYQKTKGVLTEIIGFLANNKNNIPELKKMVEGIMSGEGFKTGQRKTFKDQSVLTALKAAIINNKRTDLWKSAVNNIVSNNRAVFGSIVAHNGNDPQELKEKRLDKFVYASLHRKALEVLSMNVGWGAVTNEAVNNEEIKKYIYSANSQTPANPLTTNPVVTTSQDKAFIASIGMGGKFTLDSSNAIGIAMVDSDGRETNPLMIPIPSLIATTINGVMQNGKQANNPALHVFNMEYEDYYDGMKEDWKNQQPVNQTQNLKSHALPNEIMSKIQADTTQKAQPQVSAPQQVVAEQKPVAEVSIVKSQMLEENQTFGQEVDSHFDDFDFGSTMDGNPYMDEPVEYDEEQYSYSNDERSLFEDDEYEVEEPEENYNSRPGVKI